MKYKIDDIILYGTDGVCRITDVTERKIGNDTFKYLMLVPVYNEGSTILVPLANESLLNKMHILPSKIEFMDMIESVKNSEPQWIENDTKRKEEFRQILDKGDSYSLICFLKAIYKHQCERIAAGKKLHVVDERIMKDAEKVICDEASYSLGISRDGALSYIHDILGYGI
ncbi:MAG: CarD family transcriptional regulator [Monoglobaceae bacterium]